MVNYKTAFWLLVFVIIFVQKEEIMQYYDVSLKTPISAVVASLPDSAKTSASNLLNNIEKSVSDEDLWGKEACKEAFDYLNQVRKKNGRKSLQWDEKVYNLAYYRSKDMRDNNYVDHTNPQTGECPDNLKRKYGLRNYEYIAENAGGLTSYVGGSVTEPCKATVDGWLNSRGHRYNLLYPNHSAGAIACYHEVCVFLGLNHDNFGEGCYTAEQGIAFWKKAQRQPNEV